MIPTVIQVALGGAIGAAARYGVGVALVRPGAFPIGVLAVNIIGSFLMGLIVVYLGQKMLSHLNPFLMTGILGGFTTFSAFSLEAYTLFERGEVGQAAIYVIASVVLSIAALIAGIFIMRGLLA
ncbi:MAG: fluoride efflux transporter CrcB [Octadecabacter sp.]|jgi:CrcB protein|nr:fluoride efflux transporter CrcB [Octadecabacter sp.]MDB4052517.1 fluoride efflux transporter CrcB [Octadecabacter sp.]MDB4213611.1 fluoride efflux transporter CrcB [Octadecabacter sp.]MDC1216467.1 fluoride efflux transporter CrcB [Octadecabacter sp.]MDC1297626.1 fluoride efflux transporter CrcB [Octadecabacter sp.]|tara:strand:- start:383 stop:754 length:372 start_codon:yes stop_codon:yes gene_type:complete